MEMTYIFLTFSMIYFGWVLFDFLSVAKEFKRSWDEDHSFYNLNYKIDYSYLQKVKYLNKLNVRLSKKLNIPPPKFLFENDSEENARAFNLFLYRGIIWDVSLINNLSTKGLSSILAHELFHIKKNHSLKSVFICVFGGVLGPLAFTLLTYHFNLFDLNGQNSKYLNLLCGLTTFTCFSLYWTFVVELIRCFVSRKWEIQCDSFAAQSVGVGSYMASVNHLSRDHEFKRSHSFLDSINLFYLYLELNKSHPSWEKRVLGVKRSLGVSF